MVELNVTRVYRMELEEEWFADVIEGDVTAEKIVAFYEKDEDGLFGEALDGAEIISQSIVVIHD